MFIAPSAYVLGGVQVWLDYVVPGLVQQGHEVVVGLAVGRFHDADAYRDAHPFQDVRRIENVTGSQEGRIRTLRKAIERTDADLVMSVNIADVYPAATRLKHEGHRVRVAMTLHGIQADYFEDAVHYKGVLDGVVCTNRLVLNLLLDSDFSRNRICYAPYGVEYANRNTTKSPTHKPIRIAFVGRLDNSQKRVLDLPEILRRLDAVEVPFEFRLAGAGPAEEELRKQLARFIEADTTRLMGALTPEEVRQEVYRWADVLLVTSTWETGPIVIWEAMSNGVPVVTSSYVGSIAEDSLRNKRNCMTYPIGDCAAAADAIRQLQNPSLRAQIVEGGFELIDKKYSREASVAAWADAVSQILRLPQNNSEINTQPRARGRLDRLFGTSLAETLRRMANVRFAHRSAGAEWPHSQSDAKSDGAFLRHVAKLELLMADSATHDLTEVGR